MAMVMAIDPGTSESAYIILGDDLNPLEMGIVPNPEMRPIIHGHDGRLAIEMIASYGMSVGKEVFETCLWVGKFSEVYFADCEEEPDLIYRREVKSFVCHSQKATDANIRAGLIDLYGGDESIAVGRKATPGPLYGIRKDIWSALGIARTFVDRISNEQLSLS